MDPKAGMAAGLSAAISEYWGVWLAGFVAWAVVMWLLAKVWIRSRGDDFGGATGDDSDFDFD